MSDCPRCQMPVADADRVDAAEFAPDDGIAGLYHCRVCSLMFVVLDDGSTAEATFEG